ncbi:MAG: GNAT family N-acetyltransferase, partial [Bacteroidota bacterium]
MSMSKTVRTKSQPVTIRPWQVSDHKRLATLFNNRKIWNMLRDVVPHPYQEKDALQFIDMCSRTRKQNNFAILLADELVGGIGLIPQADVHRKSAEVGYWIGEPYWGRG